MPKNKFKKIFLLLVILFSALTIPLTASAGEFAEEPNIQLQVPILGYSKATNIAEYIKNVYQAALYIIIPFIIVMIIAAGILWIIAGGDKQIIAKAKERIKYGFIGLGIALFSYVILYTIGGTGLTELKPPQVDYIPTVYINNETPANEICNNSKPECKVNSTSKNDTNDITLLLHVAKASVANVPLYKQWTPESTANKKYGCCGTVATSGCGLMSFGMIIDYYKADLTKIKNQDWGKYRACPLNCTGAKEPACNGCTGTKYDLFVNPASQGYGPSPVLVAINLKGEIINQKHIILNYLSEGHPIIAAVKGGPARITTAGHFIVLKGCDNCKTNQNAKIMINDPNRNNDYITQQELWDNFAAAFYIHP